MRIHAVFLVLGALSLPSVQPATACTNAIPQAARDGALADMAAPSEAIPEVSEGAPSEWMRHGRVSLGNKPGQLGSILPWSVVMETAGNRVDHARVELRRMRLLVLSKKTGQWHELFSSDRVAGGYFAGKMTEKLASMPLQTGRDSSIIRTDRRYAAHFWPAAGLQEFDPQDLAGVFVSVQGRVNRADYAAGARYLMDVAADYKHSREDPTGGDAGIGRMKRLTTKWRTFYMTTADSAALERCIADSEG